MKMNLSFFVTLTILVASLSFTNVARATNGPACVGSVVLMVAAASTALITKSGSTPYAIYFSAGTILFSLCYMNDATADEILEYGTVEFSPEKYPRFKTMVDQIGYVRARNVLMMSRTGKSFDEIFEFLKIDPALIGDTPLDV